MTDSQTIHSGIDDLKTRVGDQTFVVSFEWAKQDGGTDQSSVACS